MNAQAFLDTDLGFEVAGTISSRCVVGQKSHEASFGDVLGGAGGNRAAQIDLAFSLDCNSPFRVSMTSQNGGLLTQAQGGRAFRDRLDYSAALALEDGRETEACASRDMVPGDDARCIFRFRDRAAGSAAVRLSMNADPTPLLAGTYADRLVVRITPLLGGDD